MDQPRQAALPLAFTGSGSEYFRIWIVNLLLTILTLGIYSAWAKVRRLKYFYQNTRLAEASFNYHGEPTAILKGRILALALLIAWNFAPLDQIWGLAIGLAIAAIWPWIVVRSIRFRRRNSSYRNVRFRFDGRTRELYLPFVLLLGVFLLSALLLYPGGDPEAPRFSGAQIAVGTIAAAMLLVVWPHFHFMLQQFSAAHTLYGETRFRFAARAWDFYKVYLLLVAAFVGALLLLAAPFVVLRGTGGQGDAAAFVVVLVAGIVLFYGFLLFVGPYFQVRFQNLIWNNVSLGDHRFESHARVWALFRITLVNLILIVLTLGFYRPFAVIRTLRYQIEAVRLRPAGDLDSFVAGSEAAVAAFGEEAADLFDFDLAL
jgi:uncharacterized membrane protein YjgN (DUF898 family)